MAHLLAGILGLILGIVSLANAASAEVRFDNVIASEVTGQPVRYAVYLPPGYRQDSRSYPVLYLLHGGGTGQPSDWFTLAGLDQTLDQLIESGQIRPLIAVAPDGRRDEANEIATYFMDDADGELRWQTMFFDDFMPAIELRYPILAGGQNRALMGISMGGVAATIFNLTRPGEFAGSAVISPAFRRDGELLGLSAPAYEARYGGLLGPGLEGRDRLTPEWEEMRPEKLAEATDQSIFGRIPRLFIDLGADDPFFAGAADLHIALRQAGIQHRFRVREGGHDWVYWRDNLVEAILHVDAVLTRGYGE